MSRTNSSVALKKTMAPTDKPPMSDTAGLTGTLELLEQFRRGDARARDLLVERSLPQLRKWARGRLPQWARSLTDTQDLVQDAVMRALPRLESFEARHPGALQSYLREAVQNRIYDEVRKLAPDVRGQGVALRVNPEVERALAAEENAVLKDLSSVLGHDIRVQGDPLLHQEQFDVVPL